MARSGILAEERRDLILETLSQRGSVSVSELHRRLGVSRETIRRDITRLAGEDKVRKTHGGALSLDSEEAALSERLSVNVDGKVAIARLAAEMVPDGSSLIIDSGSTTQCLVDALDEHHSLTVYTNDIAVAMRLLGRNGHHVYLLGGELGDKDAATFGQDSVSMLEHYYADFAFIGVSALSPHPLFTDYTRAAADLHSMMVTHSKTAVLLADHTKFNRIAPVRVFNMEKVATVIVDANPGDDMRRTIDELGIDLRIAGETA